VSFAAGHQLDGPASRRKFVFGIVLLGASRWPPQIVIRYPAMASPIHQMDVIRYYRDKRPWDEVRILAPSWEDVEAAIRRMDNYCFPIVQLNTTDEDENEALFNVIGGDGRWALFHMMGEWQYEDPNGSEEEARLWDSDQGYYCKAKNVLTDVEKVLRIARAYYETGSYDGLDAIE
jgi:hypothetical protein